MKSMIQTTLLLAAFSMLTACGLHGNPKKDSPLDCSFDNEKCWQTPEISGPISEIEYTSKNMGLFHFKITQTYPNTFSMKMIHKDNPAVDFQFNLNQMTQDQKNELEDYFSGKLNIKGRSIYIGPINQGLINLIQPQYISLLQVQTKGNQTFTEANDPMLERFLLDIYYQHLGYDIPFQLKSGTYYLVNRTCFNKYPIRPYATAEESNATYMDPKDNFDIKVDSIKLDLDVQNRTGNKTTTLVSQNQVETENLTFNIEDLQNLSRTIVIPHPGTLAIITLESNAFESEGQACPVGYVMQLKLMEKFVPHLGAL